jgi:hypothetical protein
MEMPVPFIPIERQIISNIIASLTGAQEELSPELRAQLAAVTPWTSIHVVRPLELLLECDGMTDRGTRQRLLETARSLSKW